MLKERWERLQLAWNIMCGSDSNLTKHVQIEVARIDPEAVLGITNIARVFAIGGHSGGSAPITIGLISAALSWKPLTPLTGQAEEWHEVEEGIFQNKRCSHVFKDVRRFDGQAYDLNGTMWENEEGCLYTDGNSTVLITFPYTPVTLYKKAADNVLT